MTDEPLTAEEAEPLFRELLAISIPDDPTATRVSDHGGLARGLHRALVRGVNAMNAGRTPGESLAQLFMLSRHVATFVRRCRVMGNRPGGVYPDGFADTAGTWEVVAGTVGELSRAVVEDRDTEKPIQALAAYLTTRGCEPVPPLVKASAEWVGPLSVAQWAKVMKLGRTAIAAKLKALEESGVVKGTRTARSIRADALTEGQYKAARQLLN